jgi:phthalate 4,5-dioxygenase oxygenase subunit
VLTQQENDRLCRIGPRTPMGALFRRYWLPICTSDRLPHPGCAPRAERLLGENFVVFRGRNGAVGVLDEFCLHRGASLALGRVEDCGIRCIYHGWKFGTDGTVLETMNNPAGKRQPRLQTAAYPVVEAGGFVWTYLGPKEHLPSAPRFAFMDLPETHRVVMRWNTHANWVQMIEGGLDSSHVSILHTNAARPGWKGTSDTKVGAMDDTGPLLEIEDTEFGYHYAAFRKDGPETNVRIVPFFMPNGRIIPGGKLLGELNSTILFEIPIDDEHTATFSVRYSSKPVSRESRLRETGFDDPNFYSQETQNFLFTRADFHKQRRDQMEDNWSGFRGISAEDAAIATSMGPIQDRTREHLIASDLAVARFRRRLLESLTRMERGENPIGHDVDHAQIAAIDAAAPASGHWRTLIPTHRVTGIAA